MLLPRARQEVYDRLGHLYWPIDQPVGPAGQVVPDIEWFSDWLVGYAASGAGSPARTPGVGP